MAHTRYRRLLFLTGMLAVLFASVGSHIVHPALHEHSYPSALASESFALARLDGRAGSQEVHARSRPRSGPCPICLLLAAFHADCVLPAELAACIGAAPERPCPPAPAASQIAFCASHAPRAPPLPLSV